MRTLFASTVAIPLIAIAAAPAAAQDGDDPYAACAAMGDDAARLACFDATYSEQRVVLAEAAAEAERRIEESFGIAAEDEAIERDEVTLAATVQEVLQGNRRSQVMLLDNGQFWREVDGSTMRNRVREGWAVTISRHWSGAYEMRFEDRPGYLRVARVQ